MELVCYVDRHIEATDDPLELTQRRHDFLASRIKNPDIIYHRTLWQVQANAARAKSIHELAAQAKLERCPYADALEADADSF